MRERKPTFICKSCLLELPREKAKLYKSGGIYENKCIDCRRAAFKKLPRPNGNINNDRLYVLHKKGYCEKCGFIGHPCQLDVDHINGLHTDDRLENLQTLCANCHRYKTLVSKEGLYASHK